MRRYLSLFWIQLRASLLLALQYRAQFLIEGLSSLFWSLLSLVPILTVYSRREAIGGWPLGESLVVLAFFLLLKNLIEGAVNPSLLRVVEQIRQGTLDFVLLKPAEAQFLVSTAKFDPSAALGLVSAFVMFGVAFVKLGHGPGLRGLMLALVLLAAAVALVYSIWIIVISAAFYVVRVDNLAYLFTSVFDAARWPVTVFKGALGLFFTFVIPLGLMTTYPAVALLGRLDGGMALGALGFTLAFAYVARRIWRHALSRYTSASS